jgi:tetratricopeptide (TPR) repeat protein
MSRLRPARAVAWLLLVGRCAAPPPAPGSMAAALHAARRLAERAEALDDAGRYREAADAYGAAADGWPPATSLGALAAVCNNQGVALLELDDHAAAAAAFERGLAALQRAPSARGAGGGGVGGDGGGLLASLWANHGLARLRLGGSEAMLESALASLDRAAALDPADPDARQHAAAAHVALGRFDAADRRLREATRLRPDDGAGWLALATLHAAPVECLAARAAGDPFVPSEAAHARALAAAAAAAAAALAAGAAADARAATFTALDPPHAALRALARARHAAATPPLERVGVAPDGGLATGGKPVAAAAPSPPSFPFSSSSSSSSSSQSACPSSAAELTVQFGVPGAGAEGAAAAALLRAHGAVILVPAAPREAAAAGAVAARELRALARAGDDASAGLRAREGRSQRTIACGSAAARAAVRALQPTLGALWGKAAASAARLVECAALETARGAAAQALHRDVRPAEPCAAELLAAQLLPRGARAGRGLLELVPNSHLADGTAPCAPLPLVAPPGALVVYDPRALHRGGAHEGGDGDGDGGARLALVLRVLRAEGLPPRDLPFAIALDDVGRHRIGDRPAARSDQIAES